MSVSAETVDHLRRRLAGRLQQAGVEPAEAAWMLRDLLEAFKGWTRTEALLQGGNEAGPWLRERMESAVERLCEGEPLQYVTGVAHFHGLRLAVDERVLIPRPETEQLVDMVADAVGTAPDLRVLDVGTGSGCIALALARTLRFPQVTALDVSPRALEVAADNARALRVKLRLLQADIFTLEPRPGEYDVIVSNPPYITAAEEGAMEQRVLAHEPRTALFAPHDDPVGLYARLAAYAFRALTPGGSLWLEINPLYARETRAAVAAAGLRGAEIIRDERGKERFVKAVK